MTTLLYQGIDKTFNFGLDANTSNNIIFLSILIKHFYLITIKASKSLIKCGKGIKFFF